MNKDKEAKFFGAGVERQEFSITKRNAIDMRSDFDTAKALLRYRHHTLDALQTPRDRRRHRELPRQLNLDLALRLAEHDDQRDLPFPLRSQAFGDGEQRRLVRLDSAARAHF